MQKNKLQKEKQLETILKNTKTVKRGITLIALVITIVVLLILAGATIAMLTGDTRNTAECTKFKKQNRNGK